MERKYLSGNIGERLQDLMKERKLTQSELAAKIEIDVSTLGVHNVNSTVHAASEKCLSGVGHPLSSVSVAKGITH